MNKDTHKTSRSERAFWRCLPITLTSFVNKCGDLGIRVFPMLLVEREVSVVQSSWIMMFVRSTTIAAALAGGLLGDKLGHRRAILASFAITAMGMFLLAGAHAVPLICFAAMLATFGQGLFTAPLRILLVRTVPSGMRQEALAWLRTANNGALLFANGIAYLGSGFGLTILFLFDGFTSLFASIVGKFRLPKDRGRFASTIPPLDTAKLTSEQKRWRYYCVILATFIAAFFTLQAEVFFVATAAQAKISFGDRGVEVFSQVMMLNTLCCMIFAVFTARFFKNLGFAFISGLTLQTAGLLLFVYHPDKMSAYFFSTLLQTAGELSFASMGQYVLLQCIPSGPREGRVYSLAIVVQLIGKTLGASLAFPFLAGGMRWAPVLITLTVVFCIVTFVLKRLLRRAGVSLA